jgi:CDP-glucose 4,6-dehydratase
MANALFNRYKGKVVLITGSTGFKGSWLSSWLLDLGAEVYGYALHPKHDLDNFVKCNLENRLHQTYGDVRDADKLQQKIRTIRPHYIFHLAAQALVIESYNDPLYTFDVNVLGTANLLQASRNSERLKSIVVITSDKCYENREVVWGYREEDKLGGKDPYSASKACAEILIKSFYESFYKDSNIAIASVRAGNVMGGGDWSENRLIPDIFKNIRENKPVEIRNPSATRPWMHVLDPLSGYLQLALYLEDSKEYEGGWNFGPSTYNHYSVESVIKEIEKNIPFRYVMDSNTQKHHEANFLKLDITKAANYLNWLPQLDFSATIKFTVDGYLAQDSNDVYNHRIQQIHEYSNLARKNKTLWAS